MKSVNIGSGSLNSHPGVREGRIASRIVLRISASVISLPACGPAYMRLPPIVRRMNFRRRTVFIKIHKRIGMNIGIPAGGPSYGRSCVWISGLCRRVLPLVQRFTGHHTGPRPMAGKVQKFDARLKVKIARNLFVNHRHLVIVCPLTRTGAEDIETVRSHSDHFAGERRRARFSPGISGIFESNRRAGNRFRRGRGVPDVLNCYRRGRVHRQPGDGQHHALVVNHPAPGSGVLGHANSVGGRQTGHHAGTGDGDGAARERVITRGRPADRVNRIRENDRDLCDSVVAHGSHGLHGGLSVERNTAEACDQEQ